MTAAQQPWQETQGMMTQRSPSTSRAEAFAHTSVLLGRVVEHVSRVAPRWILDCTTGGGGHARAVLESCPQARLIGMDRDPQAIEAASQHLRSYLVAPPPGGGLPRAVLVRACFSEAARVLREQGIDTVDAIVADLGVSSHQIDRSERGFSFRADGPLDMRMSAGEGATALELLRGMKADRLAEVLRMYGEERRARAVARAIVEARPESTAALAQVVRSVVRPSADGIDPATRSFQAIRMLVNREIEELEALLSVLPDLLSDGGVAVIVSFHSLEDRAVKQALRRHAADCLCPPRLPECRCGHVASMSIVTRKAETASPEEVRANPRARSAKLRVGQRLARAI